MIKKSILVILIIMSVSLSILWAETWYWRYYDFEPVKIYPLTEKGEIRILNINKKVTPGSTLAYEIDFDKKMNICPTIYRSLHNSYVYTMTPETPALKPMGRQKSWAALKIPRMAEYGTYHLIWTATYEIGPEKRIVSVTAVSEPFEVVK